MNDFILFLVYLAIYLNFVFALLCLIIIFIRAFFNRCGK